jgi:hypothetical protein
MNVRIVLLLGLLSSSVFAQAAIEAAAGAARATTTTVPADKLGNSINGAFDKLNRALHDAEKAKPTSPAAPVTSKKSPVSAAVKPTAMPTPAAPKPEVIFEDPSGIQEGMDYVEVTKRFGPPALQMTSGPDQETLCYTRKDMSYDLTLRSGKVTAIRKTGGTDPATAVPAK